MVIIINSTPNVIMSPEEWIQRGEIWRGKRMVKFHPSPPPWPPHGLMWHGREHSSHTLHQAAHPPSPFITIGSLFIYFAI